jgi:hypothetical protein
MVRHVLRDDDLSPAEQAEVLTSLLERSGLAASPERDW